MLTAENYFSQENNMKYMSMSQWKRFDECEAMALAELKGEYQREKTTALLIGSYVDSYFSGTLDRFMKENPEIFTKGGEGPLKADYQHANYIIQRIERDAYFMKFLQGQKQAVKTGEINGVPCKIKMDSYFPSKTIVDLKIVKDFDPIWENGLKLNFIEYWKYDYQGAFYQVVEGGKLPFLLAAATKEKPEPDIRVISIPQERLDYCLGQIESKIQRFADIKKGLIEPVRCERCNYCRKTRVLTEIVDYLQIGR
jgi:hypothetical protein